MKIKVSKDYSFMDSLYKSDLQRYYTQGDTDFSYLQDYSPTFIEEDVDEKTLEEYIKKGYAVKINC